LPQDLTKERFFFLQQYTQPTPLTKGPAASSPDFERASCDFSADAITNYYPLT